MADIETVESMFKTAIGIERRAEELYFVFKGLFPHNAEAVQLWEGMRQDEVDHAVMLGRLLSSLPADVRKSPADVDLTMKLQEVKESLGRILAREVDNLDDAYQIASDIENSEVNSVVRGLLSKYMPSEKDAVSMCESVYSLHLGRLMMFSKSMDRMLRKEVEKV